MKTKKGLDVSLNVKSHLRAFSGTLNAFSLTELLMALLVMSILMVALTPVITKRANDSLTIKGRNNYAVLTYGDANCPSVSSSILDNGNASCNGNFLVPDNATELTITLIGAGGGGGAANTSGYTEYTSAGTFDFDVPYGSNTISLTLVGGGAGGGAGNIGTDLKGIAWTHNEALNTTLVSGLTSAIINRTVSSSNILVNGNATLSVADMQNIAGNTVLVSMSGGGGGGGRGWVGAGGGGGAGYRRARVNILNKMVPVAITIGRAGQSHACNGVAGCGGGATSFGALLTAGGGGGGAWGLNAGNGTAGDNPNGGVAGIVRGGSNCTDLAGTIWTFDSAGGGGSPGGLSGTVAVCNSNFYPQGMLGGNGGGSLFGVGGIASNLAYSDTINGSGYGGGGAGGGAQPEWTGNGAPGFITMEYAPLLNGGAGGGAGAVVPRQSFAVSPNERLRLIVGAGGKGAAPAVFNTSAGVVTPAEIIGDWGKISFLYRNNGTQLIVQTNSEGGGWGANGGLSSGGQMWQSSATGWLTRGCFGPGLGNGPDGCSNIDLNVPGFVKVQFPTMAGGRELVFPYSGPFSPTDKGGSGGQITLFAQRFCSPGVGATTEAQGGDATGYGGCGGGGGRGLFRGGNGAPGYARIEYSPSNIGLGGGGASGYTIKKVKLQTRAGTIIPYTIGAGGLGGTIISHTPVQGRAGGATSFGSGPTLIKVGGGYGGKTITTNGTLPNVNVINGTGGNKADICLVANVTSSLCTGSSRGFDPSGTNGGKGADSSEGPGAQGGIFESSASVSPNVSLGRQALNIGAGGGGAAVFQRISSPTPTPTFPQGGRGGHGMIIIEWK